MSMSQTKRLGLMLHGVLASILIGWSIWATYTFWSHVFGSPVFAVGMYLLLEGSAGIGFAVHLLRIPSPVAAARHCLPIWSGLAVCKSVYDTAITHGVGIEAWVIAGIVAGVVMVMTWAVWNGIEHMILNPELVALAEAQAHEQRTNAMIARIASNIQAALRTITVMQNILATDGTAHAPMNGTAHLNTEATTFTCPHCHSVHTIRGTPARIRATQASWTYRGCPNCRLSVIQKEQRT